MNYWIGDGRLVRDPELKVVGGGVEICTFTLACDRGRKNKDGNRETDFVDCTAFGKTAAFVNKYFKKGDGALVRGCFQSHKYEGKDGMQRTSWSVWVENIDFPISKKGSNSGNAAAEQPAFTDIPAEDIPF